MTITCAVVDDEPMARRLLEGYVHDTPGLELAASLRSAVEALALLRERPPDVLFLDVQMPELTGIGLLKIAERGPLVVLTTAYDEYALEGYALDVADYLLKPISRERFLAAVERVARRLGDANAKSGEQDRGASAPATPQSEATGPDYIFVKDGTRSVRVALADIQYVEGMKDYVRIHTPSRTVTTLQSLKRLVEVLPEADFVRTHQSYIVGARWIEEVRREEVTAAARDVPVSDTYRAGVRAFVEGRELR